jgi:phosphatidylserine decarboxylase
VKRLHDYNTFDGLHKLKEIVAKQDPSMSEELMKALFPLRNKKIGQTLQDIIHRFEKSAKYKTPSDWFTPDVFATFMQYFQRKLTDEKSKEIESRTNQFTMTMPAEANIEAIGDFTDTSSILRLKKPTNDVVKDLMTAGISNVQTMEFISLKLLKCYYHRVHCPVDGTIHKITFIGRKEPLFGDNSLWVVTFNSPQGTVYMLVVGELSIQDFKFKFNEGDKVNKFDELGNFNWGSQLVLIYEKDSFKGDILLEEKQKYFVGDGIFANVRTMEPTDWEDMPNTQFSRNDQKSGVILGPGEIGSPNDAEIF